MNLLGPDHAGLFDASPNPYLILDRRLNIAGANRAYLASTKRELSDIIGRWAWDAFPTDQDTQAKSIASFERVIATGQPDTMPLLRFDIPRPETDGGGFEERWWSLVHSPVLDEHGEVAFVLQDAKDVTEEQRAKAALRISETEARRVLEGMREGFVLLGPDFRIRQVNAEGLRIDGRPADAILGRHMLEVWPETEDLPTWPLYQRAMADRQPGEITYRHASDVHDVWLEVRAYPAGDGLSIFYRDVSAAQRAQEELRLSDERFRLALEIETVGAIFFDMEGRIREANDAFLRMSGCSREDMEAGHLTWQALTPPEWLADSERAFAEMKATGVTTPYEKEYLRPDGSRWWGLFGAKLLPDGQAFEFVIDITGQRLARARRDTLTRLSDRLQDLEGTGCIAFAAAEFLGAALKAKHVGYAAVGEALEVAASGMDWAAPGTMPFLRDFEYRSLGELLDVLRQGEAVAISDVREDERTAPFAQALEIRRARTFVAVPVIEKGQLAAILFVKDDAPRAWSPEDLGMIREAAHRTHMAVERMRHAEARSRAEEALRQANETLEARVAERTAERDRVWRLSRDLLVVVRTDGVLQAVNPAWQSILGYAPEEVVGRSFLEFVWPGDEEQALDDLGSALSTSDPVQIEMRYRRKDGTLRWISWLTSVEGELVYASGRDITEEKARQAKLEAAEAARREADEFYRAYFQNSTEGLFEIGVLRDGGFSVRDVNPAYEAVVGLRRNGLLNRRLEDQFPAEIVTMVVPNYQRAVETGQVQRYRESVELNGHPLHVETVLVPVRDGQGQITRIMGSARDMTAQVEAEEKLRQSQKLDSMGQLTGGVAHDFNNLLTPIMATLDRLQTRGVGDSVERRLIDGALQSAERARVLVQRLLAFARRQPLQARAVEMGDLVLGMADLVSSTTGPQIEVGVDVAPDILPAMADANQVEMAILNLSLNARDAMPEGGRLLISAANEAVGPGHPSGAMPGHYVRLSVSDTGTGMDEATLRRAVEPFFSTKGIGKGTGLGLSMAHGLAAQLGGALALTSELGVGTTVTLWIPAVVVAEDAVEADDAPPAEPAPAAAGRVLLVDDEELVRSVAAFMLGDLGFDVTEAASAEEALRIIDGGLEPDLLVTDHLMPGMNGTDLVRFLKTRRPGLPAILVSGYANMAGVAADLPRLQKPFRSADLAQMVATVLETNRA